VTVEDLGAGQGGLAALRRRLGTLGDATRRGTEQLWIVSDGSGSPGDGLGAVLFSPFPSRGARPRALTSDSTRRAGVVVAQDLVPTMCSVALAPCVDAGPGAVIRPTDDAPPVDLYRRYLAARRMSVPIQTAAGLFVTFAGLLGVGALALGRRAPSRLTGAAAWIAIAVVPLALSLLFAGHLPTLSYATVLPAVIAGTVIGTLALIPLARARGTMEALAWLGAATLALIALEAALGWPAALHTFLGGTELDGGRFYGLPNVDIGLLLGAGVYVATRFSSVLAGVVLLGLVALFAGLPFAGANLGGGVTVAAAAGLWWGLGGGLGALRTAIATAASGGVGLVAILALNRVLPGPPTHLTNFVEGQGGGVLSTVWHRLGTGVDLIARNPFALAPVIGVPLVLAVVLRPPTRLHASFARHPGWREALLVILWGSVVAYIANDTGAAALGLGFGTALGALLLVSLRDRPGMMGAG
jgi:hypothetical protein